MGKSEIIISCIQLNLSLKESNKSHIDVEYVANTMELIRPWTMDSVKISGFEFLFS
jgi:hypothetical protein